MTELIAHRGPDDHGYHLRTARRPRPSPPLASSISPAGASRWPTRTTPSGSSSTARSTTTSRCASELIARGHRFRTHSRHRGHRPRLRGVGRRSCAKRLRGMFAFAIWDERAAAPDARARPPRHQAALLRAARGGDLVFGSEVEVAPRRARRRRRRRRRRALRLSGAALRAGAADDVPRRQEAAAGEHPHLAGRPHRRIERYWDLADVATLDDAPPTEAEATAELRERVDHVTKLRLMSEVPVGAFLSGGLDSTIITAAMLRAADARGALKTFSVGYAEDDAQSEDELAYARMAADALGTEHHEVRVSHARGRRRAAQDRLAPRRAGGRSRVRAALLPLAPRQGARHRRALRRRRRRSARRLLHLSPHGRARGAAPASRRRRAARSRSPASCSRSCRTTSVRRAARLFGRPLEASTAASRAPSTTTSRRSCTPT